MIIGRPKKLSPAFNNLYIYANSDKTAEPSFRYVTRLGAVNAQQTSLDLISVKDIKPRFGDNYLEYNFNKTAQSLLGDLTDDIDFNDAPSTVFYNTPSSGIDIVVGVDDAYQVTWPFTGTFNTFFNQIGLSGSTQPLYQAGDQIIVQGLSSYFQYDSITVGPNNYAKFNLTQPHNLQTGDFVVVEQNSPFTYPIYNGFFEVLIATNPLELVVNILFQGTSQLPQTGQLIYNAGLDGPAIVLNAGGSFPNYFVEINKSSTGTTFGPITLSPTQSGNTRYIDNRITFFPSGVIPVTTVFNGGMDRKLWLDYTSSDYSTLIDGWKFLTSLPTEWTAKLDNDFYLNFWNYGLEYDYLDLIITTKDCTGGIINDFIIPYDGSLTATTIQSINVGPAHINEICPTVEYLSNSGFWNDSDWIIFVSGNATGGIFNDSLNYNFTGSPPASGFGRVRATQNNVLTIGDTYTVCFEVVDFTNSINISINNELGVVATGAGEYCITFTATSTDFIFTMDGVGGTPSARVLYISVKNTVCDMLDCDVCSYDVRLDSRARDTRNQIFPLAIPNAWTISNFNNAFTFIDDNDILTYTDLEEFGGVGASIVSQDCVFTAGYTYTISINITNNDNVLIQAGETGTLLPFGTTGSTGTFTQTITATTDTFVLTLSGLDPTGTNGATIDSIEVFLDDVFVTSSETRSFTIDCSCKGRYTNYPIIFKDRMGSFVTFNFDLNNVQTVDNEKTKFNSFIGKYTTDNSDCVQGRYSYSLNEATNKVFSSLIMEKWELNADAMTEAESVYFEELISSPRAAIKIDGEYYAINIDDNTYTRVRKNNQKMIYHTINISFANNNPIQSL